MNTALHIALYSILSLVGIWFLVFRLYRDLEVDWFRYSLFVIRDEMFDFAAAGNISFDSPAYWMLRNQMNGFLRFGHKMTLVQAAVLALTSHEETEPLIDEFLARWDAAFADLAPGVKAKMLEYKDRADTVAVRHIVLGSPELVVTIIAPLLSIVLLIVAKSAFERAIRRLIDRFKVELGDINAVAAAYGDMQAT
jgi:hypothetical protein